MPMRRSARLSAHLPARLPARLCALATLSVLALTATGGVALAQTQPYKPPPPARPSGIAPKGDFTKGLEVARPELDPGQAAGSEGSDEAFRAKAEADAIRKANVGGGHVLVKRAGSRLMLPTGSGRPEVFDSVWPNASGNNEGAYEDYRFDGLSPDREFFVVRATFYEGSNVYWISRKDGTRYTMHGEVRPSPDGRFLVMANASASHDFNGIVVWENLGGRLVERFRFSPPLVGISFYRFMRWKDGRTVELEHTALGDEITCRDGTQEALAVLTRDGEQWAVKDVTASRCKR